MSAGEGMAMAEIVRITYDYQGSLNLRLYDPDAKETSDLTAVDVEETNMLAVDSAFERRVPVIIYVDDDKHIIRVETTGWAQKEPVPPPPVPGVIITRMATQRGDILFAEVFFTEEPTDPPIETQVRTEDPLIHIICHGAFLSKRRLQIEADGADITRVVKERPAAGP
jgi:hypothetical protein